MQSRVKGLTAARVGKDESSIKEKIGYSCIDEIQPLLEPHGVRQEILAKALNEALLEIRDKPDNGPPEEQRKLLLGLVLWKIFAKGSALWITLRTQAGNAVPPELLIAAYAVWKDAMNLAAKHGIDNAAAAESLVQVTHATADQMAKHGQDSEKGEIRDIRKYVFASYMYSIFALSAKQGSNRTDYVDMGEWIARREFSDRGAFEEAVESEILCNELLQAMPPRGRSIAVARYILGYSWPETAGALDTTVNAAQKALSTAVRQALGTCMRELRKMGHRKVAKVESHLKKNKKTSFIR